MRKGQDRPIDDWLNHLAATRFGVRAIKRIAAPLQRVIYRRTGGRMFSSIGPGRNVLLLTTTGRRTGKERMTPVFYLREGAAVVICNVRPEYERINPWVLNLRANPLARLQIGRETGLYRAREASPTEVEQLWPKFVAFWDTYRVHHEHGGQITIFVLERVRESSGGMNLRSSAVRILLCQTAPSTAPPGVSEGGGKWCRGLV